MKKLVIAMSLLVSSVSLASGGHFHPKKVAKCDANSCTEEQVKAAAPAAVKELANWKQIDAKWETAKVDNVTKKEFTKKNGKSLVAWVITLLDEKEKDTSKNKVYVYLTEDGSVFRTNTTGELK